MSTMIDYLAKTSPRSLALSESVFVAYNATIGTGIADNADPTAYSATEALMTVVNEATTASGDNQYVVPVYLRLTCSSAPTSSTDYQLIAYLDPKDRYSSGGTELTYAKSTSTDTRTGYTDRTNKAEVVFGDITAAAAGANNKRIWHRTISNDIPAVGDVYEIWFGDAPAISKLDGAYVTVVPPVWIGRGSSMVIHPLATAQAAAGAFEVEFCWVETGHPRFE